jgi:branched-chain amino acid transport system ATP-binding protein
VVEQGYPILQIRDLTKHFGGITAVDTLSFEAGKGEILGLLGPNGSGKTTLFNLVTGVFESDRGSVLFRGEDITHLAPHKVALRGISRTFQSTKIFPTQSVADNVAIAMIARARKRRITETRRKLANVLDFLLLGDVARARAGDLTHVQQRRLMVAMALVEDPEVLLLDEITAGMSAEECDEMTEIARKIREKGTTIVLIEHNMRVAMALSDRIVVLNFGRKIAEGVPSDIIKNETVLEAYLGREEA